MVEKNFDFCFLSTSPSVLVHAYAKAAAGHRVLVVDANMKPGGAWRAETVFGRENWENSPHFFRNMACRRLLQKHFGGDIVIRVPDSLYFAWEPRWPFVARSISRRSFLFLRFLASVRHCVIHKEFGSLPKDFRRLLSRRGEQDQGAYYFNKGSPHFVQNIISRIEGLEGLVVSGVTVNRLSLADGGVRVCTDGNEFFAGKVYLSPRTIFEKFDSLNLEAESFNRKHRYAIFLKMNQAPTREFYTVHPYRRNPIFFITNTSYPFNGADTEPIVCGMIGSDDLIENSDDVLSSTDVFEQAGELDEKTLDSYARLIEQKIVRAGLFSKTARATDVQYLKISDSCYTQNASTKIQSRMNGYVEFLRTTDFSQVIMDALEELPPPNVSHAAE